eukprot:m.570282 g.570282  ORF g.570282 m.570282 type:complete len:277 (-) comp22263_c3_seq3:178-1008(-)
MYTKVFAKQFFQATANAHETRMKVAISRKLLGQQTCTHGKFHRVRRCLRLFAELKRPFQNTIWGGDSGCLVIMASSITRRLVSKRKDQKVEGATIFQAKFQGDYYFDPDASSSTERATMLRTKIEEATDACDKRRKEGWKSLKVLIYVSVDCLRVVDRVTGGTISSFPVQFVEDCIDDGQQNAMFAILARENHVSVSRCYVFKCRGYANSISKAIKTQLDRTRGSVVLSPNQDGWECGSCGTRNVSANESCIMCFVKRPMATNSDRSGSAIDDATH